MVRQRFVIDLELEGSPDNHLTLETRQGDGDEVVRLLVPSFDTDAMEPSELSYSLTQAELADLVRVGQAILAGPGAPDLRAVQP